LSSWHKQFQERAADIFQQGTSDGERKLEEKEQEIAVDIDNSEQSGIWQSFEL
jgi:hypothetical protein